MVRDRFVLTHPSAGPEPNATRSTAKRSTAPVGRTNEISARGAGHVDGREGDCRTPPSASDSRNATIS